MLKNITLQSTGTCPRKMSTALFVLFSMSGFRPNTPRTVKSQVRERAIHPPEANEEKSLDILCRVDRQQFQSAYRVGPLIGK